VRRNGIQSSILVAGMLALAEVGYAQDVPEETSAKFQATYVWQRKYPFGAAYSGSHSLSPDREKSYSFTATAALGTRTWRGGELYFNPEVAQGVPLSGLTGLGGFTNAEIARTSGPSPSFYRARLFARQTWGFGGGGEKMESDANQLAGSVDRHRLVLTVGNLSVLDIFDDNAFSHDPRTQFLNWSLMTYGAYDYAADARGYSWGLALEYFHDDLRLGRPLHPAERAEPARAGPQDFQALRRPGRDRAGTQSGRTAGEAALSRLPQCREDGALPRRFGSRGSNRWGA